MASNHQPGAPSLEFTNDSDSDCYIVDSGSEVEIQFGDDTEPESVDSIDLGSDDEMFEASEFEYEGISESSTGEVTETVSDNSDDDNMDDSDDDIYDFGPNVPDRIVWGKTIFSKRFLEVRRKVERAWRVRDVNLSRTLDWGKIMKSQGYQLVQAACKQVQRNSQ